MSIDFLIVIIYLLFTLAIGLWKGRSIKNIKEYSVSDRNFPTLVLMATIFATLIGGGATLGVIEQIHSTALIFGLIFVGQIVQKLIIIKFIAPKFSKFLNKISCGGIVEELYGENAKIITGICAFLVSAGAIAAQIAAMGYVFQFFLGIDQVTGILVAAGIVILYSTFGGMSSVVATDVFQFGILIIAIPLICNLGLTKVGGYQSLFAEVPRRYFELPSKDVLYTQIIPLFIYLSIPFEALMAQRLLIAKSTEQLKSSLKIGVLIEVPFVFVIAVIGLLGVVLFPDVESRLVMPTLINELLPIGVRGFAMAGILAVIMSTADSNLNTASVSLIHDTIKPLVKVKNELLLARFVTFAIGVISIIIATSFSSVIEILATILGIWSSTILIPMFCGLLGAKVTRKGFFITLLVGITCHILGHFYLTNIYEWMSGSLFGLLGNTVSFFFFWLIAKRENILHVLTRRKIFTHFRNLFGCIKTALLYVPHMLKYVCSDYSKDRVESYGSHYVLFGAFAVINYLIPIFMWGSAIPERFYLLISIMRVAAGVLCFFLVIHQIWPKKMKQYLPQYWHLTLLYSLSFMSVFMLLLNQSSFPSVINLAIALFFLVLLVDWISFILLFCLGTLFAVVAYDFILAGRADITNIHISNEMIYLYIFTILIGGLFSGNKDLIQKKIIATKDQMNKSLKTIVEIRTAHLQDALSVKQEVLNNLSHEVRTPLQGIIGVSKELASSWSKMDDKERYKYVSIMSNSGDRLMNLVNSILDLSKFEYGKMVFDMHPNIDVYRIIHTVVDRLEAFILSEKKNIKVKIVVAQDTNIGLTCDKVKITQLFTNLLNNSVRYIRKEGNIIVHIEEDKNSKNLRICVEDDGIGIPKGEEEEIFGIFSRSSKTKKHTGGVGFGLALCREIVKAHKGKITAEGKDKGSIFTVLLPRGNSKKIIFNPKKYSAEDQDLDSPIVNNRSSKKVLLVDDEQICLDSGGMILESLGYNAIKAEDAGSAIKCLEKHPNISLILLDLMMPDMYGLELLKKLKQDPSTKNIPVIIQSGVSDIQEQKKSLKLGAVSFIKKPYKKGDI
nr:response regulator [Alphaproteobacteria bacterium]